MCVKVCWGGRASPDTIDSLIFTQLSSSACISSHGTNYEPACFLSPVVPSHSHPDYLPPALGIGPQAGWNQQPKVVIEVLDFEE